MSKHASNVNHNKIFIIISALLTFVILIGGVFLLSRKSVQDTPTLPEPISYEYYWSETCPHCANVNDFMNSWNGTDKIKIDKYEVDTSAINRQRLLARGTYCNYPQQEIGVPFLVTPDGLCFSGDQPIINYFKNLNLSDSSNP